jgi:CTP:molybdopterin cytidylyltransferase MocA
MGRPKQLLPLNGKPAIRLCVEVILAAGVTDVAAVVGAGSDEVRQAIAGLPVAVAVNADPESGMAGSVRAGMQAIDADATGVLVALADHPLVSPETIKALITSHLFDSRRLLIPRYEGRRGHPTLFPRPLLKELAAGDTLRDVITRHCDRVLLLDVGDEGVVLDLDTPEDYERIRRRPLQSP